MPPTAWSASHGCVRVEEPFALASSPTGLEGATNADWGPETVPDGTYLLKGNERSLKLAIRNRKNALFYKTLNGAAVGDLFMSLIHTCELNGANPFDYLTELQRHAGELKQAPSEWMPWNYRQTPERFLTG